MKKRFAILPALALLILGACSDKEEHRAIPNDPVQTIPAVADNVTLDIPAQNPEYAPEKGAGSNCYRFTYSNGQEIVYEVNTNVPGNCAMVKKIDGTASTVVIPPTLSARMNNQPVEIPVAGFDLYVNAVKENVKVLKICGAAHYMIVADALVNASPQYLRKQFNRCPDVERIELDPAYPQYVSVNGAIYTADFKSLVCVPKACQGTFTAVETVTTVQDSALYDCRHLDVITLPATVQKIGKGAVTATDRLLLVNILAAKAPVAYADSFGSYAYNGVLRIPEGSREAYTFEVMAEPVEPGLPGNDASDEEWEQYMAAVEAYNKALEDYSDFSDHAAFTLFKTVEQTDFK